MNEPTEDIVKEPSDEPMAKISIAQWNRVVKFCSDARRRLDRLEEIVKLEEGEKK